MQEDPDGLRWGRSGWGEQGGDGDDDDDDVASIEMTCLMSMMVMLRSTHIFALENAFGLCVSGRCLQKCLFFNYSLIFSCLDHWGGFGDHELPTKHGKRDDWSGYYPKVIFRISEYLKD